MIVLAAYTAYKITDFITQMAHELLGFNQVESARLGAFLLVMRPVCALGFGVLAGAAVVGLIAAGIIERRSRPGNIHSAGNPPG